MAQMARERQIQPHPAGREHEAGNQGKHIYHRVHRGHGGKNGVSELQRGLPQ